MEEDGGNEDYALCRAVPSLLRAPGFEIRSTLEYDDIIFLKDFFFQSFDKIFGILKIFFGNCVMYEGECWNFENIFSGLLSFN